MLDKLPYIEVKGHQGHSVRGWEKVTQKISESVRRGGNHVLVIDTYHGVDHQEILNQLVAPLDPKQIILTDEAKLPESEILSMLERALLQIKYG